MLEIDGSQGEGGGQTVRTAVALSALTGMDIHMTRIRENRPTRGLSKQHCTAIEGVSQMTDSWVMGNFPGSRDITFRPGNTRLEDLTFDVGSAGSISLVMQAMLLAARFHTNGVRMDITGGTNVMWAPPVDFYSQVLFPLMERMGFEADMQIINRGFYPEGGGRVIVNMKPPEKIKALSLLELGDFQRIEGICYCRGLPGRVADDIIHSAEKKLKDITTDITISKELSEGRSGGAGISLVAIFENGRLGSGVLGSKGYPASQVGEDAANDLLNDISSESTMDVHAADQLVPYMALSGEECEFKVWKISNHLLSQMDMLERFLDVSFGVVRIKKGYHISITPGEQ